MRVETSVIGGGNAGIADTLRAMRGLVDRSLLDPRVISTAHGIVRALPARAHDLEARAILDWVRGHFRYTRDPLPYDPDVGPADQVKTPGRLLGEIASTGVAVGDCDDYVVLLETLLRAVGLSAEAVVVSMDGGPFSHVLVRYLSPVQRKWVTLDAITPNPPGWFPTGTTDVASFDGYGLRRQSAASVQGYVDAGVLEGARGRAPQGYPGLPAGRIGKAGAPMLSGYVVPLPAPDKPPDRLARFSSRLSPYTDLLWFSWAAVTALAAVGWLHVRRS